MERVECPHCYRVIKPNSFKKHLTSKYCIDIQNEIRKLNKQKKIRLDYFHSKCREHLFNNLFT